MSSPIDLNPRSLRTVERILADHVPHCEVRAYGSRAKWEAKDYSDLDLAVVGDGPTDPRTLGDLREAFEESDLPIRVDVVDWHAIGDAFRSRIEPDCGVGQKAGKRIEMMLGDVCTKIGSGATPRGGKQAYVRNGPCSLIRSKNVHNAGFSHDGLASITQEQAESLQNFEVLRDDVLLNITGDSVARVCQVDPLVLPARVNQHVAIIRPDASKLDPEYLRYYLAAPEGQSTLLNWAGSGGTRNALTKFMIESFVVDAPAELSEQRAITRVLGVLDDKIALNRRMSETLDEMGRALFKSWFVDFDPVHAKAEGRPSGLPPHLDALFPDSFEPSELGSIPSGWTVGGLGDIVELSYGKALKAQARQFGCVPVYGSNGQVGWHNESLVSGPGIIVGRKGNPGIVKWSHTDFYPIDTTFYVVPRERPAHLHFLFFALEAQDLPSISADSAVPGLSRRLAYMNKQVMPPTRLVDTFEERVRPPFTRARDAMDESRTLAALRDTLLPKLLSGELRVPTA